MFGSLDYDLYSILFYSVLTVVALIVAASLAWIFIYTTSTKEEEQEAGPDIKARLWRRLQSAYAELFPLLDIQEKKDMMQLLLTTAANVELFKNIKPELAKKISERRAPKTNSKRVGFKLETSFF